MTGKLDAQWLEQGATKREILEPNRGHYVYVAWGTHDRPLYVGKSSALMSRMGRHLLEAPWRKKVLRFEVYSFPTEALSTQAETDAISRLRPIHNIARAAYQPVRIRAKPKPPLHPQRPKKFAHFAPVGYPDYFTPEQFEIIARVQRAGR